MTAMIKSEITIINKLGLHARAAAKLVNTASAFSSQIQLGNEQRMVDAKSIMSVMMLAASKGTTLNIEVEGRDEDAALKAIEEIVNDKFGEGE
ncbi:Phosphocarrier protein2C nitrogen regulation associated [gamma proteobacterium IMCC2047]|nr:Phosphocarrier protein2C nitrogen regulation associated [gamma proteobacterium IMCC2047]